MNHSSLDTTLVDAKLSLKFEGELTLYNLTKHKKKIDSIDLSGVTDVIIDLSKLNFLDSAASIFINNFQQQISNLHVELLCNDKEVLAMLELVKEQKLKYQEMSHRKKRNFIEKLGENSYKNYRSFLSFMSFMGELFANKIHYLTSYKNIRYKEIIFEINESAIKAFGIVALTSFLIGLVVAYQSAYQLKLYGANIFIVDMLGISVLRELAPLITAIVVAGRSGSAFTAQIGAMKMTQEIDAMKTMGFDPFTFLVWPRVLALMIVMPLLIFFADMVGIFGGMVIAQTHSHLSFTEFIHRLQGALTLKHYLIGIIKGPFFAFLIAFVSTYRGFQVSMNTESIGRYTTKSVVTAIFLVIACDALFSILLTELRL